MIHEGDVIDDVTDELAFIGFFDEFFSLFHLRNVHLRPKFLYGNDRKSRADLLIYKSEKMSLFDTFKAFFRDLTS